MQTVKDSACRIAVVADTHYYSETLGCSGRAYQLREGSDQKCLKETGAIVDAAFQQFAEDSGLDCVFVAGDVTDNGELSSHREFREKLRLLAQKKKVFVITSTHDWCSNGFSHRYLGDRVINDVPVMPEDGLKEFYGSFGYRQALDTFETDGGNASYLAELCPGFLLLALNDDHDGNGKAGFTPAHLKWAVEAVRKARARGDVVIGMCHHLMQSHISPLINNQQRQGGCETTLQQLADAGLRLLFTGHSHMHHTACYVSPQGNSLTEVNVGALSGYCAPIAYVRLTRESAEVRTEKLKSFCYKGTLVDAQPFLKKKLEDVILRIVEAGADGNKEEFLSRMGALGVKGRALSLNFGLIHWVCRIAQRATVGKTVRLLNRLTFGKAVRAGGLETVESLRVLDIVMQLFDGVFDGEAKISPEDPLYEIVLEVMSVPARCARRLPGTDRAKVPEQLIEIVRDLMDPPPPDNHQVTVTL